MVNIWIMMNLFTKIEFHYSFLIMALGLVLTGHFSNLFIFTSLILIHEFGHYFMARIFGYKVEKIIIYPYGGLTKIDTLINTSIGNELIVSIFGIVTQCIYFFLIYILYINGIVREYIYNLFCLYHKSMLIFNLLPIIPLDGFKILNLLLSKFFCFNLSNNISVFLSLVSLVLFLYSGLFEKNYSIIFVIGILMQNIYRYYYNIKYIYNRFLIERYIYDIRFKKNRVIDNINKMYKNSSHFFVKNGSFIDEKLFLTDFFKKR